MARILLVEDEKGMRQFLAIMLRQAGHEAVDSADGIDALNKIKDGGFDLVITDLRLPGVDGIEVLRTARRFMPDVQVIMITAYATTENAIEAMKLGAYDYIIKPFKVDEMKLQVEKALEKGRLISENARLRETLKKRYSLESIIGKSKFMRDIFEMIERVAVTKANILILGESGTGKELVAKAVHGLSSRIDKPFVVVNCSAIPETLMESELFGHRKGSFTGAVSDKSGLFEIADGGTIFLDEIAEVPLQIQVKLLRVLQDRTFRRVGGLSDITVDVRIVAATNRNLEAEMRAGRFREDLYYRLKVIQVKLPPLRDRREDIPILADHFLRVFSAEQNKKLDGFTPEAMKALLGFHYSGNVRQLENIIERAVTLTDSRKIDYSALAGQDSEEAASTVNFDSEVSHFESELLRKALAKSGGDGKKAAEFLNMTTRSFRYYLTKHKMTPD
jgi:two-component system response regulator PilR (NtrC family)